MKRHSIQRGLVMDAAKALDHPTADGIYTYIIERHPSVSRGTVYRNLNMLVEHGLLRRVGIPGGPDHYDISLHRHYHGYCRVCGAVCDTELPQIPDLSSFGSGGQSFAIEDYDIILRGVCSSCQSGAIDSTA